MSVTVVGPPRPSNFQTQACSHEPIFEDRRLIFGVNITHWWGIENQNFGRDPNTLPFLHFLRKQMFVTLTLPPRPSKFQTQARSHEPIFRDRTLIFGVNVTHWWGIQSIVLHVVQLIPDMCETLRKHCPTCGSVDSWPFLQNLEWCPSCGQK